MSNCCDESPLIGIDECYTFPKQCLQLSNYGSACGCCGETYIQADLSGGHNAGSCIQLKITDTTAAPAKRAKFELKFTIGCEKHSIAFCNLPQDAAQWASFIYTVLATDGVLLTNNVKTSIVSSEPGVLTLQLCGDVALTVEAVTPLAAGIAIVPTPMVMTDNSPKLGMFVAYAIDGGQLKGIKVYDPKSDVYAGFLNLPKGLKEDACVLPDHCDCNAVTGCQTIQRTGKIRVMLETAFPVPTGPVSLAIDAMGKVFAIVGPAPAGLNVLPYPHSFVMTESTIGSKLITVILH